MKIIPAIDIMGGRVVRLAQGDPERKTVYPESPLEMAGRWASCGVEMLHVVDLDGAINGKLTNFEIIKDIAAKVKVKIEMGGGVRKIETVRMILGAGIDKVVVGTGALDPVFLSKATGEFKDRIVAGIDAKDGMVCTEGWLFKTQTRAIDLAKAVERAGVSTINYTDIAKDGMLEGPNIKSLKELLKATKAKVVMSGGISSIGDVRKLAALENDGLSGMIIGKALYEKTIDLSEAMRIC